MQAAIFLDRDGVIIENRPSYVRTWDDVTFIPQALAALVRARNCPFKIIVVTNQSAVGRGIITLQAAQEINARVIEIIRAAGGRVDAAYMCPHAPEQACSCRKPKPGLLLQAAQEHSINLKRSILIGDALSDLLAGQAAEVGVLILVRTGRGEAQLALPERVKVKSFQSFPSLAEALEALPGTVQEEATSDKLAGRVDSSP